MTNHKIKQTGFADMYDRPITTDHVLFLQCSTWEGDKNDENYTDDWNGDSYWMINIAYFPKYKKKARFRHKAPEFLFCCTPTIIGNYSENKEAWDMWIGKSGRYEQTCEVFDVRPETVIR